MPPPNVRSNKKNCIKIQLKKQIINEWGGDCLTGETVEGAGLRVLSGEIG
jgi:hypothetical protein